MSRKIKSPEDLERELKKVLLSSMNKVATKGKIELQDAIQKEVYDKYTPKYYERTGDLKRSASKDVYSAGTFVNARIYNDTSKIREIAPIRKYNDPKFASKNRRYKSKTLRPQSMGKHYSTVEGYFPQEYAYFIPATINEGTSGHIFGEGAWTEPRRYFSRFLERMEKIFPKIMREELTKAGLKVIAKKR